MARFARVIAVDTPHHVTQDEGFSATLYSDQMELLVPSGFFAQNPGITITFENGVWRLKNLARNVLDSLADWIYKAKDANQREKQECVAECDMELAAELLGCVAVTLIQPELAVECVKGAGIVYAACRTLRCKA